MVGARPPIVVGQLRGQTTATARAGTSIRREGGRGRAAATVQGSTDAVGIQRVGVVTGVNRLVAGELRDVRLRLRLLLLLWERRTGATPLQLRHVTGEFAHGRGGRWSR